jgi:CRP-like cAMP-binding protein
MYFIVAGDVLMQKGERILKTLHSGEYFGEISMLLNTPFANSAVAVSNGTQVIGIPKKNFLEILSLDAEIVSKFLKDMAAKISD